jgi:hypothetical protein
MPDITAALGMWSSIRPTNNGDDSPADLTVDGYMEITGGDPGTGEITGCYRDPGEYSSVTAMRGRMSFILPNSYRITLSHPVREGVTRYYEGQLVATDNDDFGVQIVAGRYTDVRDDIRVLDAAVAADSGATVAADSFAPASGGQDNGTWVATKP